MTMAEKQKGSKKAQENEDLVEKAIIKEANKEQASKAEKLDEQVESSTENHENKMATEPTNISEDNSSEDVKMEKGSAKTSEKSALEDNKSDSDEKQPIEKKTLEVKKEVSEVENSTEDKDHSKKENISEVENTTGNKEKQALKEDKTVSDSHKEQPVAMKTSEVKKEVLAKGNSTEENNENSEKEKASEAENTIGNKEKSALKEDKSNSDGNQAMAKKTSEGEKEIYVEENSTEVNDNPSDKENVSDAKKTSEGESKVSVGGNSKEKNEKSAVEDKKPDSEEEQSTAKKTSEEKKEVSEGKNSTEVKVDDSKKENVSEGVKSTEKREKSSLKEDSLVSEKDDFASGKTGEKQSKQASETAKMEVKPSAEEDDEDFAAEDDEENEATIDNVDDALTEDSEDENVAERDEIPKKNYEKLGKEALIKEFRHLLSKYKAHHIKEQVNEIRAAFISQFEEEQEEAKEKFLEEGGNIIDFRYYSPLKKEFNTLYFEYRDKRNNYYKSLKKDLNANLDTRNALIEELKELKEEVGGEENINTTFDKFKDIQERWRNGGNIPRDRYNLVWNNYHHHVENFYDFLHLNREFRDKDFKENLDKKMKLVEQAEELAQAQDVTRAFKELQMLHKMWKEEIGPVAQEYREEIWEKFSAATKKIHESRQEYFNNIDKIHEENLAKKQAVVEGIEKIASEIVESHNAWQNQMKKVEALRDEFFKLGKVPRKKNEATWKAFKQATRTFNHNKNGFYKNQKKDQYENLEKKMELVKIAEDNKDNEDMDTTIELMKKIQGDWKKIGHVPRKDSDKIWKRFKAACNHVFDKLHADKKEALDEEKGNLTNKKELLKNIKEVKLTGDRDADLKTINGIIKEWKETGRVPFSQKNIERDFNKVLDSFFKDLDLGRKETEMIKYDNRIAAMADRQDERQIEKERFFLTKKIDEVKADINQLENNLGFFQHVPDDNPMVKKVHDNIANHKKDLEIWKAKLIKIKTLY